MFKAKVLVIEGTLRGDISFAPEFWYTHQQYPPLVSHVAAIPSNLLKLWKADWAFDDRVASAVFPLYAVALVCLVYGAVARRSSRLLGAFAAFWVSTLPLIAYLPGPPPGSGASSALADIPLSMFATGAAIAAADLLDDRRRRAALEVGLLLGLGALTKNEGLPMVVAFGLALVLCLRTARFRRTAGIVALASGLYLLLWGVIALQIPALDENYWGRISGSAISHGLSRIPGIVWAFFSGMLDFRQWNVTWLAIGIFIALGWKRLERPALRLLLLVVVFQILAYGFAYMVSGWTSPRAVMVLNNTDATDPIQVLFTLTMGRLLLHVAPVAIILATLAAPLRFRSSG
jgi:4-amino-4-deoxy-L-arabinose transferase-like glycosyltransferase